MNIPGFTAQASLLQTSKSYYSIGRSALTAGSVYPASCNWPCYTDCHGWCGIDCSDLSGNARGACLRLCNADCRRDCGCQIRCELCLLNQLIRSY